VFGTKLPSIGTLITLATIVFVAVFFIFGSALHSPFTSWDDNLLVTENANVQSMNAETLRNVFTSYDPELYIPATLVSYQIDDAIAGLSPWMFHFTNLVLHSLNTLLVMWLLFLLLGHGWLAVGLGLVFALHPLNTEAAVWIAARKDVLSTFFFLSSVVSYLYWRDDGRKWKYVLSVGLFILGLLSKVMVVTLPVILILLDLWEKKSFEKKMFWNKATHFLAALTLGIVALFGKSSNIASVSFAQEILLSAKATAFYIWKFVWPEKLTAFYPITDTISAVSMDTAFPILLTILLVSSVFSLWNKVRPLSIGIAFFLITLVPTFSNFSKNGDIYLASDRYAYIPMIGILLCLGVTASLWLESVQSQKQYESRIKSICTLLIIVIVCFGWKSVSQTKTWSSNEALYSHAVELYPNARAAQNNLGMEYLAVGEYQKAIDAFNASIQIRPDPLARSNRAAAYVAIGRIADARAEFEDMVKSSASLPDPYYGLGNLEYRAGNKEKAIEWYEEALTYDPAFANALLNLSAVYIETQQWDKAIDVLQRTAQSRPDLASSLYNLAVVYEKKGMDAQAESTYRKYLERSPGDADAMASLATLLYNRSQIDDAASLIQKLLLVDYDNPTALTLIERMKKDGFAR
jgi:tetratricopeptide (TPR) repeat protein